jgi:fructose 1,6-bisphosphate aldolase/phosphatase
MALGFQIADCKLVGPADMFDDPAYDRSRALASDIAEYMRRHGPFEPHRLPADEMEYTTLPGVLEKLEDRMEDME